MLKQFIYRLLCFYRLDKVKWRMIDVMEVHGCNITLYSDQTLIEFYERISDAYPRGIKYEKDFSALKKLYRHLCELESEFKEELVNNNCLLKN